LGIGRICSRQFTEYGFLSNPGRRNSGLTRQSLFLEKAAMDVSEMRRAIREGRTDGLSDHLLAMWHDGAGDWAAAHAVVQDMDDAAAAWIHAYLHRREGDLANADYWYRRAGRKRPAMGLDQEWVALVEALS